MKALFLISSLFFSTLTFSQVYSKEYSKTIALYQAKFFLMTQVIKDSSSIIKFEIDPLAAAASGQLTSLNYSCKSKNLSGLILGFYGTYWNNHGVHYSGFAFKNISEEKASKLLAKLARIIKDESKYLIADSDNNNIFFTFDDIKFLIYKTATNSTKIRVFWQGFDSEWEMTAFKRTKKRFERRINKNN